MFHHTAMRRRLWTWIQKLRGTSSLDIILSEEEERIKRLRQKGVKIGDGCRILTDDFSLEPYLVEIGDGVAIAGGTMFITHDGVAFLLRRTRHEAQHFGRIIVGDHTFIGQNCLIMPGTRIGSHCIVAAGSVVRGTIRDGVVVAGNPARVVGRSSLCLRLMNASPDTLDTYSLPPAEREAMIRRHFHQGAPQDQGQGLHQSPG